MLLNSSSKFWPFLSSSSSLLLLSSILLLFHFFFFLTFTFCVCVCYRHTACLNISAALYLTTQKESSLGQYKLEVRDNKICANVLVLSYHLDKLSSPLHAFPNPLLHFLGQFLIMSQRGLINYYVTRFKFSSSLNLVPRAFAGIFYPFLAFADFLNGAEFC